jgi:translation initiation factor IF-1
MIDGYEQMNHLVGKMKKMKVRKNKFIVKRKKL